MTKHYVEFYFPGSFFAETSVKEIKNREAKLDIPERCYAYSFFDREEVEVDGEILTGKRKKESGRTLIGKKYTVEDLEREFPDERILISNIKGNGYRFAVKTRQGNWQAVGKRDKVLESV